VNLLKRLEEVDSEAYSAGISSLKTDVFYPESFIGTWTSNSTCTKVLCPLGAEAFGGQNAFALASAEVTAKPLIYQSRFIRSSTNNSAVIADRLFNVQSIARVSMGESGREPFIDQPQPDDNLARHLHLTLAPVKAQVIAAIHY